MSTALDIDLATLVGEMEDQPCESIDHGHRPDVHSEGPATHYARINCTICRGSTVIKAYCSKFVVAILFDCPIQCPDCGVVVPASDIITILGPVKP